MDLTTKHTSQFRSTDVNTAEARSKEYRSVREKKVLVPVSLVGHARKPNHTFFFRQQQHQLMPSPPSPQKQPNHRDRSEPKTEALDERSGSDAAGRPLGLPPVTPSSATSSQSSPVMKSYVTSFGYGLLGSPASPRRGLTTPVCSSTSRALAYSRVIG